MLGNGEKLEGVGWRRCKEGPEGGLIMDHLTQEEEPTLLQVDDDFELDSPVVIVRLVPRLEIELKRQMAHVEPHQLLRNKIIHTATQPHKLISRPHQNPIEENPSRSISSPAI